MPRIMFPKDVQTTSSLICTSSCCSKKIVQPDLQDNYPGPPDGGRSIEGRGGGGRGSLMPSQHQILNLETLTLNLNNTSATLQQKSLTWNTRTCSRIRSLEEIDGGQPQMPTPLTNTSNDRPTSKSDGNS